MASDTGELIQVLERTGPLREPSLRQAIAALHPRGGGRGLDIGCGIGLQALLLAETASPPRSIVGLDISIGILRRAQELVAASATPRSVRLSVGDMRSLPLASDSFDLVWSEDCVGYPASNLLPLLREIARVSRPGGTVALLAYNSQAVLPGYSLLEARLNAGASAYAAYLDEADPESHFLRAGRWFPEAGIVDVRCRTFVGEVQAPLTEAQRDGLLLLFDMLWGGSQGKVAQADWLAFERLCRRGSPECILDLPDYYGMFTYTMFDGVVRK